MFFVIKLRKVLWILFIIVAIFSIYKLNTYVPTISTPVTNKIDANINVQRIFLRILVKNRWISQKQFDIEMNIL